MTLRSKNLNFKTKFHPKLLEKCENLELKAWISQHFTNTRYRVAVKQRKFTFRFSRFRTFFSKIWTAWPKGVSIMGSMITSLDVVVIVVEVEAEFETRDADGMLAIEKEIRECAWFRKFGRFERSKARSQKLSMLNFCSKKPNYFVIITSIKVHLCKYFWKLFIIKSIWKVSLHIFKIRIFSKIKQFFHLYYRG